MTDRDALLAAVVLNPSEDTPRLIYADWLEESGEADRSAFIRIQCETAKTEDEDCYGCHAPTESRHPIFGKRMHACEECRVCELRRRERELLRDVWDKVKDKPFGSFVCDGISLDKAMVPRLTFSRGFISELTLSWQDWLSHEAKLYWHAGATNRCPHCHGEGCPDHGANDQLRSRRKCCETCRGKNLIPRPFPGATVQPITAVRLTTWPGGRVAGEPWLSNALIVAAGSYTFRRMKCPKCDGNRPVNCSCYLAPINSWTCETWPGVVFSMPEAVERTAEIPQGGWELDIIHERFDSTGYHTHPPTLIRGDLSWRGPSVFGVQAQLGRTFIAQAMTRGGEVYTVQAALTHCEHEIIDSDRVPMMRLRARTTGSIGGNR